jgi:beta-glucosidase
MSRLFIICLLLLVSQSFCSLRRPWMNTNLTPAERAKQLLSQMTSDEKFVMVHGGSSQYVGYIPNNDRLGIPALTLNDASQGFRGDSYPNTTTQFPSLLNAAASFDTDIVSQYAAAITQEFLDKGSNVLLGPGMCLARVPVNGRNFEYVGEDPFLARDVVKAYVQTVQGKGVIATAKHYVNNEQELNRTEVSANLDERTAWELYYQPFLAAIEAGVGSMMCSYNKIGDVWACENNNTLNAALKESMGFTGFVMSDWGATHSTNDAANHGLDMEMPDNKYFGDALKKAVQNGAVPQARIDDMVYRILLSMFSVGIFDNPQGGDFTANVTSDGHYALARKVGANSAILLKNDNQVLPVDASKIKTIAILGDGGDLNPIVGGQGSGQVPVAHIVSPLEGIRARLASTSIKIVYAPTSPLDQAVAAAKSADVALVFAGITSSEGIDRKTLSLSDADNKLIQAVAAANPRTAAIITSPGAILLPWSDSVPAIIAALLPGQQFGNAIADVIFGDVNPSARLPVTFPNVDNEVKFTTKQYPGINNEGDYTEGLLIGYRWYDAYNVTPKFAFGHGLSYTTFQYSLIAATSTTAAVKITNTGSVAGSEAVQLYLSFPAAAQEPPKVLRRVKKVSLQPGKFTTVLFSLNEQDLQIWNSNAHDWTIVAGDYQMLIGASSGDIRLSHPFHVNGGKHTETIAI